MFMAFLRYLSIPAPEYQIEHYELGIGEIQPVDEVVWPSKLAAFTEGNEWSMRYWNFWHDGRVDVQPAVSSSV